jgi:hypothetical protein
MKLIRRSNPATVTDYLHLWGLGMCQVVEGLIHAVSFGTLSSDLTAWYLFDYLPDEKGG